MSRRKIWGGGDVTYAIRDLLDRCRLDYEVVNDERLPRDPSVRMRWVLVELSNRLVGIDPEAIETSEQFDAFVTRAERVLDQANKDENMLHPEEYWGIATKNAPSRKTTRRECSVLSPKELTRRVEEYARQTHAPGGDKSRVENHIAKRVENALRILRWRSSVDQGADLIAEDSEGRKVLIQIKATVKPRDITNFVREVRNYNLGKIRPIDSFWIVGGEIAPSARLHPEIGKDIEAFTIEEIEQRANKDEWDKYHRQVQTPPKTRGKPRAKTKIGRAVVANEEQLETLLASLQLLLEEKLAGLAAERPNSEEAQKLRNDEVARYESLKRNVEAMRQAVANFIKEPEVEEKALEKRTKTLAGGVQQWWDKDSDKICDRTYNAGLFMLACGVLGLAGTAVAVTGAAGIVFGRKSLGEVLQKMKSKLKKQ